MLACWGLWRRLAVACFALFRRPDGPPPPSRRPGRVALFVVAMVPSIASLSIASNRLGPFDTPFQPVAVTYGVRAFFDVTAHTASLIPGLEKYRNGAPFLMANQTSALAAPFIYVSGQEVLPIGGYTGTIPEPTLPTIEFMVHAGGFHLVLQSPEDHRSPAGLGRPTLPPGAAATGARCQYWPLRNLLLPPLIMTGRRPLLYSCKHPKG